MIMSMSGPEARGPGRNARYFPYFPYFPFLRGDSTCATLTGLRAVLSIDLRVILQNLRLFHGKYGNYGNTRRFLRLSLFPRASRQREVREQPER